MSSRASSQSTSSDHHRRSRTQADSARTVNNTSSYSTPKQLSKVAQLEAFLLSISDPSIRTFCEYADAYNNKTFILEMINQFSYQNPVNRALFIKLINKMDCTYNKSVLDIKLNPLLNVVVRPLIDSNEYCVCAPPNYSTQVPELLLLFHSKQKLLADNGKLLKHILEFGYPPESLGYYIRTDSLEKVIEKMGQYPELDFNVKLFSFDTSYYSNKKEFSLLSLAALYGSRSVFKFLLSKLPVDEDTIMFSIVGGNFEIIRMLEERNIRYDKYIRTAVETHRNDVVDRILLQYGQCGLTPADCVKANNIHALTYCIKSGIDVNSKTDEGKAAIHYACEKGCFDIVKYLIDNKADVDLKQDDGKYPIHIAAERLHSELVKLLVERGADVNSECGGKSAITIASSAGDAYLVGFLVKHGADINARSRGKTALHTAIQRGTSNFVSYLLSSGADSNAKTRASLGANSKTPLHFACENGNFDVVKDLYNHGANINARAEGDWTPLHFACWRGDFEIVRFLVQHSANMDAYSHNGKTPLHFACESCNTNVINYLVQQGCKIVRDSQGWTPLHICCDNGCMKAIEILVANGADVNESSGTWHPIHIACSKGDIDLMEYLISSGADINAQMIYYFIMESLAMVILAYISPLREVILTWLSFLYSLE